MRRHPLFLAVDEAAFRAYLTKENNGHGIWHASKFARIGFDQTFIDSVTRDHVSPGDPKFDIHRVHEGKVLAVEHVVGVHDLEFLHGVCRAIELNTCHARSREMAGLHMAETILKFLDTGDKSHECDCVRRFRERDANERTVFQAIVDKQAPGGRVCGWGWGGSWPVFVECIISGERNRISMSWNDFEHAAEAMGYKWRTSRGWGLVKK